MYSPDRSPTQVNPETHPNSAIGDSIEILTKIYDDPINLVVLQRPLESQVQHYCRQLIAAKPNFSMRAVFRPETSQQSLAESFPELEGKSAFIKDLALLMELYSCLFDLEEVGLRIQLLDRAMCPRFHTDKLGCRLVTTYLGPGTEWLHNNVLDRSKLGAGNQGLSDDKSGLYSADAEIEQVAEGDIVLLKGDGWIGNEGHGAVHRSPAVSQGDKRIVVTMDFG
ncbi:DUF1826 domain-containing protein [Motiliproteus coralliicola]|uniref:DUF1826 domain-containing protein n=1 Tax=Motiliproteus coralliicola TaxID=2283196 RepID=A0A369WNK1_9GAMM|nr:DUF1826 domain-containing protein [Motiliproteus coralliicola]